ncbi:YfhO family protein [Staphylococcus succinus]|uniref:YfhO family protein n=1 Tax=Staphylococcus succinus TaxID=61015 RepID=UPI003F5C4403
MKRKILYISLFMFLAIIGHSYVIYRFIYDGVLFTGPNDGMEQMVPIQMYLYDNWSHGNWFYSSDFGLGGDFFTDLSYYFSTNIIFIFNVLIIVTLKAFIPMDTSAVMFWMTNALIISIIKSTFAMVATFIYAKYISLNRKVAMLAAFIFVISPLYFRFTVYWPFFSDIFIWLPLLLWSIERFFKSGKIGVFIIVVTISLINNFYFAYYQLLTGLLYFIIRIIFRHKQDIIPRAKAILTLSLSSLLALGSSLFIFFHGIESYLNNRRVSFKGDVDLLEHFNRNTNLFFDNYLIVILFITIQALLSFKLYKHYYYKLFAFLTLLSICASFFPFIDQLFNGLSAPQKRWHYLIAFSSAILIALYTKYFRTLSIKNYIFSTLIGLSCVFMSAWYYDDFVEWIWFVPVVSLIGLLILLVNEPYVRVNLTQFFILSIMILSILVSIVFIRNQIYYEDHIRRGNVRYATESLYDSPLQQRLVNKMKQHTGDDERIDWRVNDQDNTPMYQHFKGMSLYSSIFDHNILDYYYDALKINMQNESVSIYQSTNGRQNIASLFSVRYLMIKNYQDNIPRYFKKIKSDGQYQIYKNTLTLPSVRITDKVYDAKQLKHPVDREHAMIDGVVINHRGQSYPHKAENLLNQSDITYHDINHKKEHLIHIAKSNGRIQIHVPKKLSTRYKDFYVTLFVKRGRPDSNFSVNVNGYVNSRLFNNSTYRTGVDTQLYRTQPNKNDNINIDLAPGGDYEVDIKALHGVNYQNLIKAHHSSDFDHHYKNIKNGIKVHLGQHKKGIASINTPYRKGMHAYIDGKKVKPFKVNYMMTGVPVSKDNKEIVIQYRPKYWYTMIVISSICIVASAIWVYFRRKNNI